VDCTASVLIESSSSKFEKNGGTILKPTTANATRTATPRTNFRVAIRNRRQVAGCEVPIASFPLREGLFLRLESGRGHSLRKSLAQKSLAQSLEILGYGRNLNVLPL